MRYCKECGSSLRDTDNFCSNCGAKVQRNKADSFTGIQSNPFFVKDFEKLLKSCSCIPLFVKDFPVETRDGSKTTIDYVALTNHGMFIFNLVNAVGSIREIPKSSYWECDGIELANPLKKSETNLDSIKSFFLKWKFANFFSYIVFPDEADLTNVNCGNAVRITKLSGLKKKIEDDIGNYGLIYSDEDMQQVSKILSPDSFRTGQAEEKYRKDLSTGAKWSQGKLILGILSLLSAAFIITRFYYVQGSNHLLLNNSGIEGASLLAATCYIITGIIAVAARKTKKRFPWILCTLLLFFSCFGIASTGVINNFQIIWGLFSLILGAFYLLSAARRPAGIFISILFTCLIAAFCLQLLNILPKVLLYF